MQSLNSYCVQEGVVVTLRAVTFVDFKTSFSSEIGERVICSEEMVKWIKHNEV